MRIGLVAGEASGDVLGAGLIRALAARFSDARFEGVAGPEMIAAGCEPWAEAEELAVMGLIEPLREIPRLLRLRKSLIARWRASPPDVFVGIDAPDFNLGLEKRLRRSGIRTVHYVSPTVWAWRPGRIESVRKAADRVLCILPFEQSLYDSKGIDAVFVGHPRADSLLMDHDTKALKRTLGVDPDERLVAVLPGSRSGEIARLGPVFAGAAKRLAAADPALQFVLPVASPRLREPMLAYLESAGIRDRFTVTDGGSESAMAAADVVMLASGTAALEAALLCKPMVAAYKVSYFSATIFRLFRLLKLDYVTMPNLLTETPLVPECIQEQATPERVADEVAALLEDPERREGIARRFAKLRSELALNANDRAADAVAALVESDDTRS